LLAEVFADSHSDSFGFWWTSFSSHDRFNWQIRITEIVTANSYMPALVCMKNDVEEIVWGLKSFIVNKYGKL